MVGAASSRRDGASERHHRHACSGSGTGARSPRPRVAHAPPQNVVGTVTPPPAPSLARAFQWLRAAGRGGVPRASARLGRTRRLQRRTGQRNFRRQAGAANSLCRLRGRDEPRTRRVHVAAPRASEAGGRDRRVDGDEAAGRALSRGVTGGLGHGPSQSRVRQVRFEAARAQKLRASRPHADAPARELKALRPHGRQRRDPCAPGHRARAPPKRWWWLGTRAGAREAVQPKRVPSPAAQGRREECGRARRPGCCYKTPGRCSLGGGGRGGGRRSQVRRGGGAGGRRICPV
mmetsp:Transcript_63535/g.124749  ORF Transcript_63535/g.124749 Transcript_63535/m.124749 type:complete len:290 (+) Transcript_63535:351-1220(+)